MTTRCMVTLVLNLCVTAVFATTLSAQTTSAIDQTTTTQTTQTCATPCTQASTASTPTQTGGGIVGELYVNAGGVWPNRIDELGDKKFKAQGVYGLKGGVYVGQNFEVEGSFGYLNHWEPSTSPNPLSFNTTGTIGQPSILGSLYDANFAWNFGNRSMFGTHFEPYAVFGGGGLTAEVRHGSSAFFNGGGVVPNFTTGTLVPNPARVAVI